MAEGYPVDIHRGTCTDWTAEPAYDVGLMEKTNVAAEGEQEVGDTEAALPDAAGELGDVYTVDQDVDFTGNELLEEGPYVVGVHQSEDDYGTLVACGNVFDIPEGDDMVVPLQPVSDSNLTGVALMSPDDGSLTAYLWNCEPLEQAEHATPAPTQTPEPSPTTNPTVEVTETEVVEATEVVETTKVVTETEVEPAPTATSMAEQAGEGTVIELGDEPVAITSQAGGSFVVTNTGDADRGFRIADLDIEETIPAGEELEVTITDDVEAGAYTYEVLESKSSRAS